MKQVYELHKQFDLLQEKYGDPTLSCIYGAGCISNPKLMFIFMNPTGRNISSEKDWNGIRAPWLGTKQIWFLFRELELLSDYIYSDIVRRKPLDWDIDFCNKVYKDIEERGLYITNLAKCTQIDARPLINTIFREYLNLVLEEISIVNPQKIITFGNQVSSILLSRNISVSNYKDLEFEQLNGFSVYPTYYPVGQGRRNMPMAVKRIRSIILQD